mgnify:CR=1 FL=1
MPYIEERAAKVRKKIDICKKSEVLRGRICVIQYFFVILQQIMQCNNL